MSMVDLVLRVITCEALRGNTIAGDAVHDSPLNPFELALKTGPVPLIAIHSALAIEKPEGRDWLAADRRLDLSFQILLPVTVVVPTADGTIELKTMIAGADPAFDIVTRSIMRALIADQGPWATLWRKFVACIEEVVAVSYMIEGEKGARIAAREITVKLDPIAEPMFEAVEAGSVWDQVLAAMRGRADLAALADAVQFAIETGNPLATDWDRAAAALGLNRETVDAIGIGSVIPPTDPVELDVLGIASSDQGEVYDLTTTDPNA